MPHQARAEVRAQGRRARAVQEARGKIVGGAGAVSPASPTPAPTAAASKLVVKITTTKGDVLVDGKPVEDAELDATLAAAVKADPNVAVIIVAAATMPHGRVVEILDRAKRAGVTKLGIGHKDDKVTAPTMAGDPTRPTVVLSIPATGNVMVGATSVADADLDKHLADLVARNKDVRVAVEADKHVSYARVWGVLDRAKKAGIKMIGVIGPGPARSGAGPARSGAGPARSGAGPARSGPAAKTSPPPPPRLPAPKGADVKAPNSKTAPAR